MVFLSLAALTPAPPPLSFREAAHLACTCRGFRAAHAESVWPAFDPATGNALEPRSGRFWRELSPGDDLRAAVNKCPTGGCILLRPGTHTLEPHLNFAGMVGLMIFLPVRIFGRGLATVQSPGSDVIASFLMFPKNHCGCAVLDGLTLQRAAGDGSASPVGVLADGGSFRLQACAVAGPNCHGVRLVTKQGDASLSPPVVIGCRCGRQ